jgi:hypothetical protein
VFESRRGHWEFQELGVAVLAMQPFACTMLAARSSGRFLRCRRGASVERVEVRPAVGLVVPAVGAHRQADVAVPQHSLDVVGIGDAASQNPRGIGVGEAVGGGAGRPFVVPSAITSSGIRPSGARWDRARMGRA